MLTTLTCHTIIGSVGTYNIIECRDLDILYSLCLTKLRVLMGLNYVFYSPVVAIHGANFTSGKLLRGCDGVGMENCTMFI